MLSLAGAVLAPIVGAFLYRWLHGRPGTVRLFDTFMYVAIPALVVLQTVPHAWERYGALVFLALFLGIAVPSLMERVSRVLARHTDGIALIAGFSGIAVHAVLEGGALALGDTGLAFPLVLHRVLEGLAIWWLLEPRYGFRGGVSGLCVLLLATVGGYAAGTVLFAEPSGPVDLYQAFVGGSLVHVVFHQSRHDHAHD